MILKYNFEDFESSSFHKVFVGDYFFYITNPVLWHTIAYLEIFDFLKKKKTNLSCMAFLFPVCSFQLCTVSFKDEHKKELFSMY